jgi:hypothetical protein
MFDYVRRSEDFLIPRSAQIQAWSWKAGMLYAIKFQRR